MYISKLNSYVIPVMQNIDDLNLSTNTKRAKKHYLRTKGELQFMFL